MAARDHFRALARRSVHMRGVLRDLSGRWQGDATIVDLALSGACVETEVDLTGGTAISIQVLAPNLWDPLVLQAEVAWSQDLRDRRGMRVGLRFIHRSAAPLHALVELLGTQAYE